MTSILDLLRDYQGIIGVLAGMFGAQALRNMGKTHIEFQNCSFKYMKIGYDELGQFIEKEILPSTEGQNDCYFSMDIEIYNSSETPRILRNLQIQFNKNKKIIGKSIPQDEATEKTSASGSRVDDLKIINIHAKEIKRFSISGCIGLETNFDKVYFTATQNRSKKLKKLILRV